MPARGTCSAAQVSSGAARRTTPEVAGDGWNAPGETLDFERHLAIARESLADVVEANARSDDADGAQAALDRLAERAESTRTAWALGLLARRPSPLSSTTARSIRTDQTARTRPPVRPSRRPRLRAILLRER